MAKALCLKIGVEPAVGFWQEEEYQTIQAEKQS